TKGRYLSAGRGLTGGEAYGRHRARANRRRQATNREVTRAGARRVVTVRKTIVYRARRDDGACRASDGERRILRTRGPIEAMSCRRNVARIDQCSRTAEAQLADRGAGERRRPANQ